MRTLHILFIILSIVGFGLLWVGSFLNGTLDAMNAAKDAGVLPNGRPLRSTYTGFRMLDDLLTTLTIFFDGLVNGLDPGPRLLLGDLSVLLQAVVLWILIESRRRGNGFAGSIL